MANFDGKTMTIELPDIPRINLDDATTRELWQFHKDREQAAEQYAKAINALIGERDRIVAESKLSAVRISERYPQGAFLLLDGTLIQVSKSDPHWPGNVYERDVIVV